MRFGRSGIGGLCRDGSLKTAVSAELAVAIETGLPEGVELAPVLFDITGGGEGMKYVLLFCGSAEDAAAFEAMSPDELRARYAQVGAWFAEHRGKIGGSNQLQGPETATLVQFGPAGPPVVTDGPYLEGKESIGGYAEIEVADLDEALRMAKTWPGRGTVEIRPVTTGR
jgi:hypothetical protein